MWQKKNLDEYYPTTHVVNHQPLVIRYMGEGEWFVGLQNDKKETIANKTIMFSGYKGELIDSLQQKPLVW